MKVYDQLQSRNMSDVQAREAGGHRHRATPPNVGALIIRIGFWGFLIIIIVEYTPNPIPIIKAPILGRRGPWGRLK